MAKLLEINKLSLAYATKEGRFVLFRNLDLAIDKGEVVGLVGESGCGKSSLGFAIIRLLPKNAGIESGSINFDGRPLTSMDEKEMSAIRGKEISMVFQDPMTSLNPLFTIKKQITWVIGKHTGLQREQALERALELLRLVELPDPSRILDAYPHELSGGMQQRVMVAMALSSNPKLMIADEPTTAVDATIQAQILELLVRLKNELDFSILFITHNLDIVGEVCQRVMVMYAGEIVEEGPAAQVLASPKHPYTIALIESIPRFHTTDAHIDELKVISGSVPDLFNRPSGCPFHPRCEFVKDVCSKSDPARRLVGPDQSACCHLYPEQ